ncbi:metalloprotease TldD [Reyranella sp.]|uniref:metalloprotease TldD n=1 Tax=Reyranella sp. TaxID=1929291 RepID=UPI0027319A5D|nr:metalloprotease TldD [Reyranella sp.]MDP2375037.1 metalloprotease TldD [Reyranella sp.]
MSKSINHLATADGLFFGKGALDQRKTSKTVDEALAGTDDGELFLEYVQSESLSFDDGKLKSASFDTTQGFGLRAVAGDSTGFAHASALDEQALKRAAATVKTVRTGRSSKSDESPRGTNRLLYADDNPIDGEAFARKVALLEEIDAYVRGKEPKARQVSISLAGSWQVVEIIRAGGWRAADVRPLVRLNVSVVCGDGTRMEAGSTGSGRRAAYGDIFKPEYWKREADEAIRQALVNLESVDTPAGEMPVVLGAGWSGVLWHEAVGHGLEGDFHRKKTSVFSHMMGDMIASPGVTVVDDGTLNDRRGSLTIDDEGTPTQRNVLIENGRLVGLMQDRQNARLMGVKPTGNGRRQSHAYAPMPRMTNTCMRGGDKYPKEIIATVKKGLYAANFGGGQVDIVSGKFVFSCTEAYLIENGKLGRPVKGATLIGAGSEALTKVSMVGNDMELDPGIGTCGKDGQGVPVGVGQPTLRIDALTVGGTAT